MSRIIAVANQKGGVGKTTTSVNLAAALAERKKRVLLVDSDPQGNATSGLGVSKNLSPTVYDALVGGVDIKKVVVHTKFCDLAPTGVALAAAELELSGREKREFCMRAALAPVREDYDFVIIDCPPALGLTTINALCAADGVLMPVQCEYFALEGLSDLTRTIKIIRAKLHPELEVEGVLLTMYDSRTNLSAQVAGEVKRFFPGKVFKTAIPRSVRLSEAPSHGLPINAYDRANKGADAYAELAGEVIKNVKRA